MGLLVVGSVAYDALETPFGKTDKIVGGSGSYISLSASYFTSKTNLVAVVGGDFSRSHIEGMQTHGINTEGLQVRENEKSFFWKGRYHTDMNSRDTLVTELNVLADFDPIIPENYQDCSYLMLGNLAPSVQRTVIERLRNRPKLIAMDTMNFWMDTAWDDLMETLKLVDVLIVNDSEARQLADDFSLVKAARKIRAMGPKIVIIKKGEHGALLFFEDKLFYAPALPLEEVFDPTGAGDTFAGGFIGFLARQREVTFDNMKRAVIYGSAMASFCVEKFGMERLMNLTPSEINGRVSQFVNLVKFEALQL